MIFLPIVVRELSIAARRPSSYSSRVWASALAIIVMAGLLMITSHFSPAEQGKLLFSILSAAAFVYCLLIGIRATADCMSLEKREGTLGLLFLTDLKGYDVVFGKLVSASLSSFYSLIAIVPVMALALLLGGLTAGEIVRIALLMVNTLFFSLSAGVLVSTLSQNERKAMFGTICLILAITFAPLGAFLLISGNAANQSFNAVSSGFAAAVFAPSPLFAFILTQATSLGKPMIQEFFNSLLCTHLLSWVLLAAAARVLPRTCQDRPKSVKRLRWRERWERWSYGDTTRRKIFRARMLDQNPFFWLAGRDRLKARYVWFFLGSMILLWIAGFVAMRESIFDWEVSCFVHFMIHGFLKIWLTSETCSRFVEDRRSGALELLLSSPLRVPEIARGQDLALRRQFARPILAVVTIDLLLLFIGIKSFRHGISPLDMTLMVCAGLIVLLADLMALKWVAMWQALLVTHLNRAVIKTLFSILALPWMIYAAGYFSLFLGYQLTGRTSSDISGQFLVASWLAIALANNLIFASSAKRRFLRDLRAVATQSYPLGDKPTKTSFRIPSLKNWIASRSKRSQRENASQSLLGRHRWAWSALTVVALSIGFIVWYRFSLARQINARLEALSKAGHPITLAGLDKLYPVVARGENAGDVFKQAAYRLVPPESISKTLPPMGKLPFSSLTDPLSSEMKEAMTRLRTNNREALDIFRSATALTTSHYAFDFSLVNGSTVNWGLILGLRRIAHIAQFAAILEAEEGNTDMAIQDLNGIFALYRSLRQAPLHTAQWHLSACLNMALTTLERLLVTNGLSDLQLDQLLSLIRDAEDKNLDGLKRSLQGGLLVGIGTYRMPTDPRLMDPTAPKTFSLLFGVLDTLNKASGRSDRDFLFYLQTMKASIEATRLAFPQILDRADQIDEHLNHGNRGELMPKLSRILLPQFKGVVILEGEVRARLGAAQTAVAIERFRLKNENRLPETLEQLRPSFLTAIPVDPFNGEPLRYKQLKAGYVVYSVGSDKADDGGQYHLRSTKKGSDITFTVEK